MSHLAYPAFPHSGWLKGRATYRASCWYENTGVRGCNAAHNAYSTTVFAGSNKDDFVNIGPSWTRGLAIHPVGAPPPSPSLAPA